MSKEKLIVTKKNLKKLSEKEIKELDSHIDFLLTSIEPITKQLVEPRFCLTFNKKTMCELFNKGIKSFGSVSFEMFQQWYAVQSSRKNAAKDLRNIDDNLLYGAYQAIDNVYMCLITIINQVEQIKFCPVACSREAEFNGDRKYKKRLGVQYSKFSGQCQDRETIGEISKDLLKWGNLLDKATQTSLFPVTLGVMPGWVKDSTGKKMYLFCVDLDNKDKLKGKLEALIEQVNQAGFKTYTVKTPSGGYHLYYFSSKKESNHPLCKRVDVRG